LCGICPARPWTREGDWRVVRCSGCDLFITWPRPDDATLAGIYGDQRYYEDRSVGCCVTAAWPERARAIIEALGFSRLIHSLEHVADPLRTLTALRAAVEPGGMVFIEVPHAGSVDMWWPRRRRGILDLPVHLYHFVPATLVGAVERAGLRVVEVRLSNPDTLEWALEKRARWRNVEGAGEGIPGGAEAGLSPSNSAPGSVRSLWSSRMLPWIRRHFPGGKLQLLATRAS
jgi:hypothetical protein